MSNISASDVENIPEVHVFFDNATIQRVHLIRSDGNRALICDDRGVVSLLSLDNIKKISPITNDKFVCRFDDHTCAIVSKDENGVVRSLGPVRGQLDTSISLEKLAKGMKLDWNMMLAAIGEKPNNPPVEFKEAVRPSKDFAADEEASSNLSFEALMGDELLQLKEELDVPDLDIFDSENSVVNSDNDDTAQ